MAYSYPTLKWVSFKIHNKSDLLLVKDGWWSCKGNCHYVSEHRILVVRFGRISRKSQIDKKCLMDVCGTATIVMYICHWTSSLLGTYWTNHYCYLKSTKCAWKLNLKSCVPGHMCLCAESEKELNVPSILRVEAMMFLNVDHLGGNIFTIKSANRDRSKQYSREWLKKLTVSPIRNLKHQTMCGKLLSFK